MKGYRERYRPVPLFTEGYRIQACSRRGTGIQAWTGVQACRGGGGGGGFTGLYSGYRLVQG